MNLKIKTFVCALFATLLCVACQSKMKEVPFSVAERYFVKNTVQGEVPTEITTEAEFNNLFGMAAVMGDKGRPTPVDFTKQFVIAVVKPATDYTTKLVPVSLQRTAHGELHFTYTMEIGEKQSYSTRPALIIVVDKSDAGKVLLTEENVKP